MKSFGDIYVLKKADGVSFNRGVDSWFV